MENTVNTPQTTQPALLVTRSAAGCLSGAQNTPVPKMLFGEFWSEGELSVLFGGEGLGKSMLAVQVADAITRGGAVKGFTTETAAQKVLYFDFATSDRQFARRYNGHAFSDNFIRVTINPRHWELRKFGEQLVAAIEAAVKDNEARVVIIDSLATLKFFVNEVFLLSHLARLKDSLNLSVLLLAGAKKAQPGRSLSLGNLAANKIVCGIAPSIFAMGENQDDKSRRYLIHLKGDEHGKVYHRDNVIVGRNASPSATDCLPGFEFIGRETEQQQWAQPLPKDGSEAKILEYRSKAPYASLGEIAKWTGTNKMKVKRVLEKFEILNPKFENLPDEPVLVVSSFSGTESSNSPGSNIKLPGVPSQPVKKPVNTAVTPVTPNSKPAAFYPLPQHPDIRHTNEPGEEETLEQSLKTLDAMITSYCKPQPKTESQKPLTYSQQLKKRLAEARKAGKK